jgi:hypothetical protein
MHATRLLHGPSTKSRIISCSEGGKLPLTSRSSAYMRIYVNTLQKFVAELRSNQNAGPQELNLL